jgi:colanic acid biosynthesis glycosyl transferase WcaI
MNDPSSVLFVSRYYWPELIGSAPFSTDIAEWLAAHGRPTTVVSGLPHYPHDEIRLKKTYWEATQQYPRKISV